MSISSRQANIDPNGIIKVDAAAIVIIGDGPMALLMAIKFRQLGIKDVYIVGPRLEEFTRSGDADLELFEKLADAIAPLRVKPSSARHIKDIEKELYTHVKHLSVHLVHGKFLGLEDNRVKIQLNNSAITYLESKIVYDCTGTKRAVIDYVNNNSPTPAFTRTDFDLSFKSYALVRGTAKELTFESDHVTPMNIDPVDYTSLMQALRKLGWTSYVIPFYKARLIHAYPDQTKKYNIYFAIPDHFKTHDEVLKFLALLMAFNDSFNHQKNDFQLLHQSKKHPIKENISLFKINPAQITPAYCYSHNMFIFHLGDASANLPFFSGKSLILNIKKFLTLLESFKIANQKIIQINIKKYTDDYRASLYKHKNTLSKIYDYETKLINSWRAACDKIYSMAIASVKDHDQKELLSNELNSIRILSKLHEAKNVDRSKLYELQNNHQLMIDAVINQLNNNLLEFKSNFNEYTKNPLALDSFSKKLTTAYETAKLALAELPKNDAKLTRQPLEVCAIELAHFLKELAQHLFKFEKLKQAKIFYEYALNLHKKCINHADYQEQLTLTSNLIVLAIKLNQPSKVLELANQIQTRLREHIDLQVSHKILEKISYSVVNALLQIQEENLVQLQLESDYESFLNFAVRLNEIESQLTNLADNATLYNACAINLKNLASQFALICKNAASNLYSAAKYAEAYRYCAMGLEIYELYLPDDHYQEKLNLLTKQIIYAYKMHAQDIENLILIAENLIPHVDANNDLNKKCIEKIGFYKILFLINKLKKSPSEQTELRDAIKNEISQLNNKAIAENFLQQLATDIKPEMAVKHK